MLEQLMHSLTVEGKPGQLPTEIEHDVTALVLGDQLHVGDVAAARRACIVTNDAEELIAMISVPRGLEPRAKAKSRPRRSRAPRVPRARSAGGRARPRTTADSSGVGACVRCGAARVHRSAPVRRPTCSWSGSAIPARSTRARSTTSAPRWSSSSRAGTAAGCARARSARSSTRCASAASGSRSRCRPPT